MDIHNNLINFATVYYGGFTRPMGFGPGLTHSVVFISKSVEM